MKKSVEINHRGMTFSVEYATELLGVISILCGDQDAICDAGAEWGNGEYRNEVLCLFVDRCAVGVDPSDDPVL